MNYYKKYIFLLFFLTFSTNLSSEIYFIDLEKILITSNVGKSLDNSIKNFKEKKLNELESQKKILLEKEKNLLNKKNVIEKNEYDDILNSLKIEVSDFNKKTNDFNVEVNNLTNNYKNKFYKILQPILMKYAEDNNISHLVERKFVLIADNSFDITEEVTKIVDKKIKIEMFNE